MKRLILATVLSVLGVTARAEVQIQQVTSPAGINAWLVEEHEIPFVALEIYFKGGTSLDEPGKRGATNLMMGLLEEGSGEMTAQDFQRERESLAASYGFDAYDDGVSVSAKFLTENRDDAVALLRQALVAPRFDQDAIDRVKGQVLAGIASRKTDPNRIAGDSFYSEAYGDHPYGTDDSGTEETIRALTQDDIFKAYRNALVEGRAYVSAVGDINAEELGQVIDNLLSGLPEDGPAVPGAVDFGLTGGATIVDFATPQSVILFGHAGIERDDPDFFAAYVLNTILGGDGPQSILMNEVREKRGLTYGIYTYLVDKDYSNMWLGSVATANEKVGETIDVILDNWARVATVGVSQEELDNAKTYLTGAYPLRFDGNEEIAGIMVGMQVQGLPPEYVVERNDYIEAVTLEDINRVAQRLLNPDALHFTIVGQPEGVDEAMLTDVGEE
ncbi:insulinase family protein [Marivivens donghaensis]|uniref:Insulinase family protein n=1 Tax=Marivivens donghaensis TaxID=1699413 RepID=A0ABX0VYA8_9RHOB|nr:pitrilysin family protein [Marivivens donghaensis]NIY71637.1 insulinase family protein [Marivivens donghaensis]